LLSKVRPRRYRSGFCICLGLHVRIFGGETF
jgi:hypothetical protein